MSQKKAADSFRTVLGATGVLVVLALTTGCSQPTSSSTADGRTLDVYGRSVPARNVVPVSTTNYPSGIDDHYYIGGPSIKSPGGG
jgi:hypothetical protein